MLNLFVDKVMDSDLLWMYDRSWVYERLVDGFFSEKYARNVDKLILFAVQHQPFNYSGYLKCPCLKCWKRDYLLVDVVRMYLYTSLKWVSQ